MTDNRNTILAVILSGLVLLGWQYFFNIPQMEKQRAAQLAQSELVKPVPDAGTATPQTGAAPAPSATWRAVSNKRRMAEAISWSLTSTNSSITRGSRARVEAKGSRVASPSANVATESVTMRRPSLHER